MSDAVMLLFEIYHDKEVLERRKNNQFEDIKSPILTKSLHCSVYLHNLKETSLEDNNAHALIDSDCIITKEDMIRSIQ